MIDLKYVNRSSDDAIPDVVVVQKDDGAPDLHNAVAWKVIRRCARGLFHPFQFPFPLEICLGNDFGNFTERMPASPGARFAIRPLWHGRELVPRGADGGSDDIAIRNELPRGAADICLYRDGRLVARRGALVPGQSATFRMRPVLWFGAMSGVRQGQRLGDAVLDAPLAALPLTGLASATIVLRGGRDRPCEFAFEDVRKV